MKTAAIILVTLYLIAFIIGSIFYSANAQATKKEQQTVVFVSNSMWTIKFKIDSTMRVSPEYRVKFITGQSVSTSVNSRSNSSSVYDSQYRDLKGDILCIIER